MPRRQSPEEEWLSQPEGSGEVTSPEGDIPPWGQRDYKGAFPMGGKLFYLTAYIGVGPEGTSRAPAEAPAPVPSLGEATPVMDVGTHPGTPLGTEYMYFPFAAIPIRNEDFGDMKPVVDYLAGLIRELGVYGKILIEPSFPESSEVQLPNGRWFPVDLSPREYGGISFVNAYNVNRIYGGHEEGGWWYDAGTPVSSVPIREEDGLSEVEWKSYLQEKVSWTSPYDKYSILGRDVYEVGLEKFFASHYPQERPRYS